VVSIVAFVHTIILLFLHLSFPSLEPFLFQADFTSPGQLSAKELSGTQDTAPVKPASHKVRVTTYLLSPIHYALGTFPIFWMVSIASSLVLGAIKIKLPEFSLLGSFVFQGDLTNPGQPPAKEKSSAQHTAPVKPASRKVR
jgi:hypothetical protein